MKENYNATKRQHFVPRVFLGGFSPDYVPGGKRNPQEVPFIWRFSSTDGEQKYVPVTSVCYENNLYEYTGKQGEYVLRNHLEKVLSQLESMFFEFRTNLEKKVCLESNLATNCFLDNNEKDFWVHYVSQQILRDPEVIEVASELGRKILSESLTEKQSRNIALSFCVPYLRKMNENTEEAKVFCGIAAPMRDSDYHVIYDKNGGFVTGRHPVYIEAKVSPNEGVEYYDLVVFPISAQICMVLTKKKGKSYRNRLHLGNDICGKDVLYWLSQRNEEIFSNHKLSEKEIEIIKGEKEPDGQANQDKVKNALD